MSRASVVAVTDVLDYRIGRELGRGGFGIVYEALHTKSGASFAVKRLPLDDVNAPELANIEAEIALLASLKHPNIVGYVETLRLSKELYIICELCENGSLLTAIKRFGLFTEQLAAIYCAQSLRGLAYLHEQGILHRDIKAANILLNKSGVAKLADFGIAVRTVGAGVAKGDVDNPPGVIYNAAADDLDPEDISGSPYWLGAFQREGTREIANAIYTR